MVFSRVSCIWNGNWAIVPSARSAHWRSPKATYLSIGLWISSLPLSLLDVEAWRGALVSKDWSVWRAGPPPSPSSLFVLFSWDGREEPGPPAPGSGAISVARGESERAAARLIAAQVNFLSSPQSVRQPLARSLPSGFMRSEACWGALALSRKAPPQGSFPDCGKPFAKCPGSPAFPLTSALPPLPAPPGSPRPCPQGRAVPILGLPTQAIPEGTFTSMKILSQPPKPDSDRRSQPEIRVLFSRCRAWQKKSAFY